MSGNTLKYLTQVSSFLKVPAGKLTVNSDTVSVNNVNKLQT